MEAQSGHGIGRSTRRDRIEQLDELTQVNNRRSFFELAELRFGSAAECTAIVVDLDRLGYVNDTYGHHAGSELIRETAAALIALADPDDVVGRLGGDELALLRPQAVASTEELREQVSEVLASASRSDRPFGLSVSVGVASARADEVGTLDALLSLADDAMYEHKQAGGGRRGRPHVRRSRRAGAA